MAAHIKYGGSGASHLCNVKIMKWRLCILTLHSSTANGTASLRRNAIQRWRQHNGYNFSFNYWLLRARQPAAAVAAAAFSSYSLCGILCTSQPLLPTQPSAPAFSLIRLLRFSAGRAQAYLQNFAGKHFTLSRFASCGRA